ncbi:MAG: hypothetical protein WD512_10950 [Candidatus Paceibacterota bacterium]
MSIELPKLVSDIIKYYYEKTEWEELLKKRYVQIERAELKLYVKSLELNPYTTYTRRSDYSARERFGRGRRNTEFIPRKERFARFVKEQQLQEYNKKYRKYFTEK